MKKLLLPLIALALIFSACEKKEPVDTLTVKSSAHACTLYPLEIGNQWIYRNSIDGNSIDTAQIISTATVGGNEYYALINTSDEPDEAGLFRCDSAFVYQLVFPADSSLGFPKDIVNRVVKGQTFTGDSWQDVFDFGDGERTIVTSTLNKIHQNLQVSGFNFKAVLEIQVETKTIIGSTTSPSTIVTRWIAADVGLVKSRSQDDDSLNFDIIDFSLN